MDIVSFKKIVDGCAELLNNNGFKSSDITGEFLKDNQKFVIKQNDETKMMNLYYTENTDLEGNEEIISGWLFEGNEGDIPVIVEDFCEQIGVKLGVAKPSASISRNDIVMPTKKAKGDEYTVDSLTGKVLAIYPVLKEVYKHNVAEYNKFLYIDFYKKNIVSKLRAQSENYSVNKKAIDKIFKLLAEAYYNCDRETSDLICGVIIAGSFYDRADKLTDCLEPLSDFPFFKEACKAVVEEAGKNKKFKEMMK